MLVALNRSYVALQFADVLTRGQVVSVLRESNGGNRSRVAWEVGHICTLLQIPDLDLRISSSSAKNKTIRVELSTGESFGVKENPYFLKQ